MAAKSQYFGIRIDTTDLDELVDSISSLDGATLSELRDATVNTVSLQVNQASVDSTLGYLNLTRDYVETKIERMTAKKGSGRAAVRSDIRGTTLQRFGMQQQTVPVNWSNARILAMGKKFSEWPGWTERTGDQYGPRNIAPNDKQAGIKVQIYRGKAPVYFTHGFSVGLENDNGYGLFSWHKDQKAGKPHHKYGPSVYQTFRHYIKTNDQKISDDLITEFYSGLDRILKGMTK